MDGITAVTPTRVVSSGIFSEATTAPVTLAAVLPAVRVQVQALLPEVAAARAPVLRTVPRLENSNNGEAFANKQRTI